MDVRKRRWWSLSRAIAVALLALLLGATAPEADERRARNDAVLRWNAIALDVIAEDHSGTWSATTAGGPRPDQAGPTRSSRALAIVHLAIYDAVNAIDGSHSPYISVELPPRVLARAATRAAVAQAAHDTLAALYPSQRAPLEAKLSRFLRSVSPDRGRAAGVRVGATAARGILEARARDGSRRPSPYTPGGEPGDHRPDPLHPDQGFLDPGWGQVDTFAGMDVADPLFRAPPPPSIDSDAYAEAYEEVFVLGGDGEFTTTERSRMQTEIGLFWAYDGTIGVGPPPRMLNQAVRTIARRKNNTLVDNARLFALVNAALADAGIAAWESKYHYDYWRPIVGIRDGDRDGNDQTVGEATWKPLGSPASNQSGTDFTPPFPAYPSGHATFGAATFRVLERFYGTDRMRYRLKSDEMNGTTTDWAGEPRERVVRRFRSFSQAANENAASRLYLGVHWRFDATAGLVQGSAVADYIFDNLLR